MKLRNEVWQQVREKLQQGLVPPIFHAFLSLLYKKDPLFNDDQHKLSAAPVEAGGCDFLQEGTRLKGTNRSIGHFFTSEGKARSGLKDEALGGHWDFDEDSTTAIAQLVNESAHMVGHDVESTKIASSFGMHAVHKEYLVTRRLSRGVVADCFHRSKEDSELAIVGSPGIGKSWTLLYALQQALLYESACVILHRQKTETANLFIRRGDTVFAWSGTTKGRANSVLFDLKDVLVLLDPPESGAFYAPGSCMLIYAASNNKKHFQGDIFKTNSSQAQRHLSQPSIEEVRVMLPIISPGCNIEEAQERAQVVGMLPRYLIEEKYFKDRKDLTEGAVLRLKKDPKEMEKVLDSHGQSNKDYTVPGTIFAVSAAVLLDDDEPDEYDGLVGINYGERKLSIMSDFVMKSLVRASRESILSFWAKVGCGKRSGIGDAVEELFWDDLSQGPFKMETWTREVRSVPGQLKTEDSWKPKPHNGVKLEEAADHVTNDGDIVCRMVKGCPLIDNAGPGRRVYQVTVGDDHSMYLDAMIKLLVSFGYLSTKPTKQGVLIEISPKPPQENLLFYWVAPYGIKNTWVNHAPKKYKKRKRKRGQNDSEIVEVNRAIEVVNKCLAEHVQQYILIVNNEL